MMYFRSFTGLKGFKVLVVLVCLSVFVYMIHKQYLNYSLEETGTSLKWKSVDPLPFPAISICDSHYENAKVRKDLKVPQMPFSTAKEMRANPLPFYQYHINNDKDIESGIWKYYMTVDKMIYPSTDDEYRITGEKKFHQCKIGTASCSIDWQQVTKPDKVSITPEIQVQAGKWVSRILADSYQGYTYLCHTLIPNVTVDFSKQGGNSLAIRFLTSYKYHSPYWKIFVHDKYEHVSLHTHALEALASLTMVRYNKSAKMFNKKKALIKPRLIEMADPSQLHPCSLEPVYSQTWCNIKWGWQQKVNSIKNNLSDKFNCVLPGIWINDNATRPVCHTLEGSNSTLGYHDYFTTYFDSALTHPAIGLYKATSGCIRRCSRFDYSLSMDQISEYDQDTYR